MKKSIKIMLCFLTAIFIASGNAEAKGANDNLAMLNSEFVNSPVTIEFMRSYLIEAGLPESIVISMSDSIVTEWYNRIQNKNVVFSEGHESVYSIDNNISNEDGISPASNIQADELKLEIFYCNYLNERGNIEYVEIGIGAEWLTVPYFQGTDAMAVNWDSDLFAFTGMYALVSNRVGNTYYDVATITRPNAQVQGGFGVTFPLKKGNMSQSGYPVVEIIMTLQPAVADSISPNSSIRSNINFNYAHTIASITPSIGFSTSGGTIGFNISNGYNEASTEIIYNPGHENVDYGEW